MAEQGSNRTRNLRPRRALTPRGPSCGGGRPDVLGQDEGKLKLIHGAEHTPLTATVCVGHNLIYTAVHLCHPQPPGFNTLIFGLNVRSSGFYYHQDAEIPGLSAKV